LGLAVKPIKRYVTDLERNQYGYFTYVYIIKESTLDTLLSKLTAKSHINWYNVVVTTERGRRKSKDYRSYTLKPPSIQEIGGMKIIYAYTHETMSLKDSGLFDKFLKLLPDEMAKEIGKLPVELISEIIFVQGKERVLAIIPSSSRKAVNRYIMGVFKRSNIIVEAPLYIPGPEDFLYWLLIKSRINDTITSKNGMYRITNIRKLQGATISKVYKGSSKGKSFLTNDIIVDLIIHQQELVNDLTVIITDYLGNTYGVSFINMDGIIIYDIKARFSDIQAPNHVIKRLVILNELFTRIIPDLVDAYNNDSSWKQLREQIAENARKMTIDEFREFLNSMIKS